jgi:hypothetical protein
VDVHFGCREQQEVEAHLLKFSLSAFRNEQLQGGMMKNREEPKRKKSDKDARQGPASPPGGHTRTPAKGQQGQHPQKNPNDRPVDEDIDEENEVEHRRRA